MLLSLRNFNFFSFIFGLLLFVTLFCCPNYLFADPPSGDDTVTRVICNVILFVQTLGLPIMTGVIIGSSIMAIFGRLAWPAIVMLIVFTAIFFGAGAVIAKFASGITSAGSSSGQDVCAQYKQ